ncbi:hypothetical protein [Arenibaculum sp.]|uniref:hypothetical protein n=1 Tax=Arenibaculum sp. TaxID=2865862 RepID=UPI002E11A2D0|nr:hypothetical protein [Arenibaculum sp.]
MAFTPVPIEPIRPKVAPAPVPVVGAGTLAPRREAFCRHVASGVAPVTAARLAGFPWDKAGSCARALLAEPDVTARLVEIVVACRARHQDLRNRLMSRLLRVLDVALAAGDRTDALRAIRIAQGFEAEPDPLDALQDQEEEDNDAAPADPADLSEEGAPPAMPPLPHEHAPLRGPLDSPENLEGISDLLRDAETWLPSITRCRKAADAVFRLMEDHNGHLPDDYDVRNYPWGLGDYYRDELIESRRARGLDPIDGRPLRTPKQ